MDKKMYFISAGARYFSGKKVWTILTHKKELVNLPYMPFLDQLYPKNKPIPCIVSQNQRGIDSIRYDMGSIYEELYEEDCEVDFKCDGMATDPNTFGKYLKLSDDYGFHFRLFGPSQEDIKCIGGKITCYVKGVSEKGLDLRSLTKDEESAALADDNQLALFQKLHDSRVDDFKVFNKKSYRGYFDSLKNKYPDSAHFIYELMQNADDAFATNVTILLNHNSLVFKHNGTERFTISDVALEADDDYDRKKGHINSITGIGDSSKLSDEKVNKIGKFGVGFKSIFQYTTAPEIYDDFFRFRIVNYIIPELINHDHVQREDGETLIFIPFTNPETAYQDTLNKLRGLANANLFLNCMKSIVWEDVTTGEKREYSKSILESFTRNNIRSQKILLKDYQSEKKMWMFSKKVDVGTSKKHDICVGFYLTGEGHIDMSVRPNVFCFFPTSETFNTFIIAHAPFLLTESRQHLLPSNKFNNSLVEELGKLAAESLIILRDIGLKEGSPLIGRNIIELAKLEDYWDTRRYNESAEKLICKNAVAKQCREIMKREALLLSKSGNYLLPKQAYLYSPAKFAEIIDAKQLQALVGSDIPVDFVNPELNTIINDDILIDIPISSFGPVDAARSFTPEFMAAQPATWLNKLFRFIVSEADGDLWKPDGDSPVFLDSPIIKTNDGRWVTPYNGSSINVFYEAENAEGYNIVSDEMLASKPIAKFLDEIGCKKPDQNDFILSRLLPNYSNYSNYSEDTDTGILVNDFKLIYDYCQTCSAESRENLISRLSEDFLLRYRSSDGAGLTSPSSIYLDSKALKEYFEGYRMARIIDTDTYKPIVNQIGQEKFNAFLAELGVMSEPAVIEDDECGSWKWRLSDHQKEQLGYNGLNKTWCTSSQNTLEGLSHALSRDVSKTVSKALWKWLCLMDRKPILQLEFRYQYYQYYTKYCDSSTLELLRESAWIVNNKNERFRPRDISMEDFSKLGYLDNFELCKLLGIETARKSLESLGASKEQIESCALGDKAKRLGLTEKDLEEMARMKAERKKTEAKEKDKEEKAPDASSDLPERQEMSKSGKEMFSGTTESSEGSKDKGKGYSAQEKIEAVQEKAREKIQDAQDKAKHDMEELQQVAELREEISAPGMKYTKLWFEDLLELEYRSGSGNGQAGSRAVSISFSSVHKEVGGERIYVLKSPSRAIPIELENIPGLEVRFQFLDRDEFTMGFEVASVRDFTLRLKAKASDAETLLEVDWSKCTKASIDVNNPVELTGKLVSAFKDLDFDYDEDEYGDNPNLKELLAEKYNISFIYGPPGTGKTTHIAEKIIELINDKSEYEMSILVLAPTNKACDEVALKICEKEDNPEWMRRFVMSDNDELQQKGLICGRDSRIYDSNRFCLISTMARLPYDGFRNTSDGITKLKDMHWDYVIVDEASMVSVAHAVYTIYQFPYAEIIFAGDPNQIPPIVHEEAWESENIYTMVGLSSFADPVTEPVQFPVEKLMKQYRSVPAIGEVFSRFSYDGQIEHMRTYEDRIPLKIAGYPIKSINIIPFKVERYDNIFGARKLAGSPVHLYSVILTLELCKFIAKEYQKNGTRDITVGVICPYASEAQMIDKLLEQQVDIPDNIKISVGTIHGFQGGQCDIIFTVFNPPVGLAGIRSEEQRSRIFLNRKNIINVGISRAKDYMFVLLPHGETAGYENLTELDRLGSIIYRYAEDEVTNFTCDEVEEFIFGEKFHIEHHLFSTSHQLANVYTKPEKQYEIRIDENAVDIQIG